MATKKRRRLWNLSHKNYLQKNLILLREIQSALSLANQDLLEAEVNAFLLKTHQKDLKKLASDVKAHDAAGQRDQAEIASQELQAKEKLKSRLPKRVVSECFGKTGAILENVHSVECYVRSTAELEPFVSGLLVLPNNLLHRGKTVRLCFDLVESLGAEWEATVSHHCKDPIAVDGKFLSAALGHRELTLEGAIRVMDVLGDFLIEKFKVSARYYQLLDGPNVYEDWRHNEFAGTQSRLALESLKPLNKESFIQQATLRSQEGENSPTTHSHEEPSPKNIEPAISEKQRVPDAHDPNPTDNNIPQGSVESGAEIVTGIVNRNSLATATGFRVENNITVGASEQSVVVKGANESGLSRSTWLGFLGLAVLSIAVGWWIVRDRPENGGVPTSSKVDDSISLGEESTIELIEAPYDKVMKEPGFSRLSTDLFNKKLYLEDDVLAEIQAYTNKEDLATAAIFYACDFPDEFETNRYRCKIKSGKPAMAISYVIKDVTPYRVSDGLFQTQFDLNEIDRPVTFAIFLFPKDIEAEHSVSLTYRPVLKGK